MTSYIALDLNFLEKAPTIARAAGVDEDTVLGGMSRLWAFCFREKTDVLSAIHLRGLFHTDTDLTESLCVFGALERVENGFRVRGASRYLRIQEGRSRGGKKAAAAGNLKRGSSAPPQLPPSLPPAAPQHPPQLEPSLTPAFHRTSSIEHRTSIKAKEDPEPSVRSLCVALEAVYEKCRGEKYKHGGAKDTKALKDLLAVATPDAIVRRWQLAIQSPDKWRSASKFTELNFKWNDLALLGNTNSTAPVMGVSPENVWREGMAPINEEIIL